VGLTLLLADGRIEKLMRRLFLKFEGLRGPSTAPRHIGDFEVLFYTFSHQPMRRAGPPLAGEEMENYVEIQKWPDRSTSDLKLAWTKERVFPTCELIEEEVSDAGHLIRKVVFRMRRVVLHTMSTLQFEKIGLKFESMSVVK
jgi:hypothetical protein